MSARTHEAGAAARRAPWSARRAALALAATLLAFPSGCGKAPDTPPFPDTARLEPLNVVLVCLDTVRADRLGCYGYGGNPTTPALDALAADATLFRDTSAAAGWTKPSVPSFFTGTFPCQHGVYEGSARGIAGATTDLLPAAAATLAERFRAAGYATAAVIHNAQLRRGGGFEQGFDTYEDDAGDARDVRARASRWLDGRDPDRPFFLYLHFLDAHWPYDVPDEAARRFTAGDVDFFRGGDSRALRDAVNDGSVTLDAAQQETLSALYDGALRFLDDELGAFLADLRARGLYDATVISVVADHGEEFLEHGRIGHGHGVWQNLLAVPWILRVPGRAPGELSASVALVDLPPTLLAAAGLPPEGAGEGVDRLAHPDRPVLLLAENKAPDRYVQSLRVGTRKLVRTWTPPASAGPRDGAPAALAAAASVLQAGTRWEAEIEPSAGALRATQLKPRPEPARDPLELRARAADVAGDAFTLAGVTVRLLPGASVTGDAAQAQAGLRQDALVKAQGVLRDGELACDRLKFYAEGDAGAEVRGAVEAVELHDGAARVRLSGLWIAFDEDTHWKDVTLPEGAEGGSLDRQELAAALALGADAAARAGWRVDCALYDLLADPGEQAPRARCAAPLPPDADEDVRRLSEAADLQLRELLARRTWTAGDEATLSDSAVDALRQIGYVR